jgi:hypothetical protein
MAQKTNLNVAPYFDDFDANNDYHRVLFKPGYPVQARELNNLQSILQNQIERFGQHFFKEGAKVIPGNTGYNSVYYCVQLNNIFQGVPVSAYAEQLVGSKITGEVSGVSAVVDKILLPEDSENGNLTLYINYLNTNPSDNQTLQFSDGESLSCNQNITSGLLGNSLITAGDAFAITLDNNASQVGSCFNISEGIYFIRGQFVNVSTETLILDQYSDRPSYRIGLFVSEEIINSDIDEQLTDNSQGFNNYAAPGADRLKISTSLFKKSLTDFDDDNFIELATIENGVLRSKVKTSEYSKFTDELARRTYAESGDYVVNPFQISVKESLNNRTGNQGVFNDEQVTPGGAIPSDSIALYQISPGKAFVRGYEVEALNTLFLDAEKPRSIKTLENQSIPYNVGSTLKLNRVYGCPTIGIGNTYILSLRSERVGASTTIAPGKEIGLARVYDFALESGSYNTSNLDLNEWDISLYDVQPITEIVLNESVTLNTPTFVQGNNSGATGFLVDSVSSTKVLKIYDKKGEFLQNESFSFDGLDSGIVAVAVTSHSLSNVKSVYGTVGSASTFCADVIQTTKFNVGIATVGPERFHANSRVLLTSISELVSIGTTEIYVSSVDRVSVGSSISVGSVLTNVPVVSVGSTSILIDSSDIPSTVTLTTVVSAGQTVSSGSSTIYVDNMNGVSVGSSISVVGLAITNAPIVSIGDTFANIGIGYTIASEIAAGAAVTFTNVSPLYSGLEVDFTVPVYTSTIKSFNEAFPGNLVKQDDLLSYTDTSQNNPVFVKVVSIGSSTVEVRGINGVPGIASSELPTNTLEVTDLKLISTPLQPASDTTLYTPLPRDNVQSLTLKDSSLVIKKQYTVNINNNQLSTPLSADTNEIFSTFDEERYSLVRSDGTIEPLSSDKFALINGGEQLQIYNLGSNDVGAKLIATLRKTNPKEKVKRKLRVNSLTIDKSKYSFSGIGETTSNDGLIFGNYPYGTRVQDSIISLNTPDIIKIHGIFESADNDAPSSPKANLASINGPTTTTSDLIVGEKVVGQNSGAVAIIAEKTTASQISFLYKNQNLFREGEVVVFEESGIQASIVSLESPSFDISQNYTFGTGQEGTFYGHGIITRKQDYSEPVKKLKVYFESAYYDSSDDGDITTVNSYSTFNYIDEITSVNGKRLSDIIDIRPRVSDASISENSRSPLEFYGRTFNAAGNSAANILAPDEAIITTFSFYLGRIDRIYITKDGKFQVKYGTPSEKPQKPISVDDALEIATVSLPPYLYNTSQASIEFLEHKRYRMSDIRNLENRIKNLEYYTTLSLLETNTSNLFVPDSEGINRFKSGFYVDNFTTLLSQQFNLEVKNSIDPANKELRPSHYTTSVDLVHGPVNLIDSDVDLAFSQIEGINTRKTGDIVTLDYAEVEWLKQSFATRSESVTPFLISFWQGTVELTPASDTWVDTVRLEAKVINAEGNYAETLANAARTMNVDPQTGFAPTVWNAWETNWTGRQVTTSSRTVNTSRSWWEGWSIVTQNNVVQQTFQNVVETGTSTRTGTRTVVTEVFDRTSVGDRVVSKDIVPYMRSRNIQFVSKKLKPLTRMYAFFDGVDVTRYCVPKLLEISMISGVFEVGERVVGTVRQTGLNPTSDSDVAARIGFRVAQTNHKEGPYDSPTKLFPQNPYTSQVLPSVYSSTSTILNVDVFSLSNEPQGEYSGWVESGMILVGERSGAQATISNVRLVSDLSATLMGSFYIPNPNTSVHPRFESGTKTLSFVNNDTNDQDAASTIAEEAFTSSGTLETVQENIISIRNARVENKQQFEERAASRTSGDQLINSRVISTQTSRQWIQRWYDPLAQSFLVDDQSGVFLTRCDVFFRSKDDMDIPVTFQLRTMENGFPTQYVIPFSEVVLDPDDVFTSGDGSVATPIQFKAPVYLEGGKEYCICLASVSTKYSVYISRIGEEDLLNQTFISNQPYLGSLFKSQNASTWEPSQWEDLKFTLYRADFLENGTVEFYSPKLSEGNNQIARLMPDSLSMSSKQVKINLTSPLDDSQFTLGNTVLQTGTNATGNYVGSAGSIAQTTLNIINSGIGYTPSSGTLTFNNVNLETITGSGRGATASITISEGSIVSGGATIVNGGSGYRIGDVLGISSIGSLNVGVNARLSITSIASTNQIIIDNVQGNFTSGLGNTITYVNNSGITTDLNSTSGGVSASEILVINDGLHVRVNHKNHGMYFNDNYVILSNVESDVKPSKLSASYNANSNGIISVDNASAFSSFENVGVGTTNPGYLLIGSEVVEYTSVSGNNIGGNIVRGDNPQTYPVGTPVYKYELNGISLKRINKTHYLGEATVDNPITFDSYTIKINTSTDGKDRSIDNGFPELHQNLTKSTGGKNIKSTQNIPFEIITPVVHNVTVQGTSLNAEVRTVSGKSFSGEEIPFTDNGFELLEINTPNYLSTPRLICSDVNEQNKLSTLPGNKSLNMRLTLETTDSKLSPVIDTQRISTILTSNRINNIITNYATDSRVNQIDTDPSAFQYISKEITLENPATSLKVLLNAYLNEYHDLRLFYSINEKTGIEPIFVPFPGYNNLDQRNQVINPADNSGLPDSYIIKSKLLEFDSNLLDFREYTFTADQLPPFRTFRVKIVGTSTNQAYVPRIKDLRTIALA